MPLLDSRLEAGQRLARVQNRLIARKEEEREPQVVLAPTQSLPPTFLQPEVPTQPIEQQTLLQPQAQQSVQQQPVPQGGGLLGAIGQVAGLANAAKTIGGFLGGGASAGAGSIGTVAGVPVGTSIGSSALPGAAGLPAGVASSLFTGLGGFAFPLAAAAIPLAFGLSKGSRPSLKARIGFNDRGRPIVADADARGDLTSADADVLGREAISALDSVRRELGAEFNTDVGDFGLISARGGRFIVQDKSFIKGGGDPQTGLIGGFRNIEDARDAFVIGALRSGALKGDQKKIDAKIRELAPVFERETSIAEAPDIGAINNFSQNNPSGLNLFLDAIRQTDDPASVLLQTSRPVELVANPSFVGGPNDAGPILIPKENPFLVDKLPPPRVLPEGFARGGI